MEERKTIFGYFSQVCTLFGVMMLLMNFFCVIFGDAAKDFSTMFALGSKGLSVCTMMEFFLLSPIIVFFRFLFFTDVVIKRLSVVLRAACMVLLVLLATAVFVVLFGWFPINMWQSWMMFFLSFGICFFISTLLTAWKERVENRKMEEALKKLKQEEQSK